MPYSTLIIFNILLCLTNGELNLYFMFSLTQVSEATEGKQRFIINCSCYSELPLLQCCFDYLIIIFYILNKNINVQKFMKELYKGNSESCN